jgi:hypothetical protein
VATVSFYSPLKTKSKSVLCGKNPALT